MPNFGAEQPMSPAFGPEQHMPPRFGAEQHMPAFGAGQHMPPAFGAEQPGGIPVEARGGSVPQPRDGTDQPAVGSARAVSASAAVPMPNRVQPADAEQIPAPSAPRQARVYGRPAQPDEAEAEQAPAAWGRQPGESAFGNPAPAQRPDEDQAAGSPWNPRRDDADQAGQPDSGDAGSTWTRRPGEPRSDGPPWGAGEDGGDPYGRRSENEGNGPQPSGRISGRATASARAVPPANSQAPPFSEMTDDVAGRGRPGGANPLDRYTEHTTDIAHRGPGSDPLYVPAPALPPMPPTDPASDGNRMGGLFPGPASRATVTPPPGPDGTASWPTAGPDQGNRAAGSSEQSRFHQFKPEAEAAPPATPHVRMLPVLVSVIIGAVLLVGLAIGVVWLISRGSDSGGFSVSAGECVKRSGEEAIKATCGDAGSFQVVSVVDAKEQCADPGQPYVLNPTKNGKTQVLCLKPSS
jgi:hypothetical protein